MASTRLTNSIKDQLTTMLIEHAFSARCVKQLDTELVFAQKIYDLYMDKTTVNVNGIKVKLVDMIKNIPDSWKTKDTDFYVEIAGSREKIDRYYGVGNPNSNFVGVIYPHHSDRVKWFFSPNFNSYSVSMVIPARDKLANEFTKLKDARKDLEKEISTLEKSTRSTMDTVTSVQKLIVLWPEVEAFASKFLTEKSAATQFLPVIAREKLNDALGLPPHSKVA